MKQRLTIKKILIDNRGEIAARILRTCKRLDIGAVIAYSTRDAGSYAVREALKLSRADPRYGTVLIGGDLARDSYEDIDGVIAAAKAYECDAVHPGYGFLSERADAAERIQAAGITFIGPSSKTIHQVGNKASARTLAEQLQVPVMPATPLLSRYAEAEAAAKKMGYPVVLKADVGGGGMNNAFIETPAQLKESFENFNLRNPGGFYIEKKLEHARHIELQLAADSFGKVVVLGERDCTAQRKAQKVIEESPALIVKPSTLESMSAQAIAMAIASHYKGVGTWEFLYDPRTGKHYFMEINPRIQVEHTVTEERYDELDLVEWQIRIAQGEHLPKFPTQRKNHVIQLRLYTEDPKQDFRTLSGPLATLQLPSPGKNLRVDRGYEQGDTVPAGLDPTIAKLIVTGKNRDEARARAIKALEAVVVSGVTTNRDFLLWLLQSAEYAGNTLWTTFIEAGWKNEQIGRFTDVSRFIGSGTFKEYPRPATFNTDTFGQNLIYQRRGVDRSYSEDIQKLHQTHPDTCGFRYGIYEDTESGIRLGLGYWDFAVMGGTLGSEEGAAVGALFQLAAKENLPVVTMTSSSGARQQEGAKALEMMDVILAYRYQYRPPLYVNVYSGLNFGGVTVSLAESADVRMAVNGSRIGFAGPDLVARMMGKQSGKDLPPGAHSTIDHYNDRNLELIVNDLAQARDRTLRLVQDAGLAEPVTMAPPSPTLFTSDTPSRRFDRPASQRSHALMADLGRSPLVSFVETSARRRAQKDLTPVEKRMLLTEARRPTAADWLNPSMGIFDDVSPLSLRELIDGGEQFMPIIGAIAQLDSQPVMVLAHQTQRRQNKNDELEKLYVAPRAKDFRWALRQAQLANRLRLPIILMTDTTGGDASLEEEAEGVSQAISQFLGLFHDGRSITVPVISVTIGENGSGGGLTFARPLDAAADFSNAFTFVSTPDAQIKILTDNWPSDPAQAAAIINQLQDGTAKGRLRMEQIDEIIEEPAGGAQADPSVLASQTRDFLKRHLSILTALPAGELLARRFERAARAGRYALDETDSDD